MHRRTSLATITFALIFSSPCWAQHKTEIPFDDAGSFIYDEPYHAASSITPVADPSTIFNTSYYGCNSCNSHSCYNNSCCGPLTVRVGAVFLKRESPDSVALVFNNAGNGPEVLNGNDFDFDYKAGIDAGVIFQRSDHDFGIGVRFISVNDWTASRSVTGLTNAAINTNPVQNLTSSNVHGAYSSELESFEVNLRKTYSPCVTLLAGFRYIDLDEQLDFHFYGGSSPDLFWRTNNNLYGFQLGAEAVLHQSCKWQIDGFGKFGIFANDASVNSQTIIPNNPNDTNGGTDDDHTAYFAELGINGSYQLSDCWSVGAGYRVMWLDGVLEAANQVPVTSNTAATLSHDYSSVFYHGATASLQARW